MNLQKLLNTAIGVRFEDEEVKPDLFSLTGQQIQCPIECDMKGKYPQCYFSKQFYMRCDRYRDDLSQRE